MKVSQVGGYPHKYAETPLGIGAIQNVLARVLLNSGENRRSA
jgi:hypothetical protein